MSSIVRSGSASRNRLSSSLNGRIEAELVLNLEEPPLNQIKDGLAVHVIFNMGAAEVEEIGELIVFRGFAAGSGNNDEAS